MPENCGLVALKGITELKNASMFTLLHLARDNGLELYFCKVDVADLPIVKRPAILHANDHFILAEEGKTLEEANYTGWVLTSKPIGIPLPYSLAKQISGGKKGGDFLGPIVVGLASIINPFLGAAVGLGFAAHQVTGGAGVTGHKGEFWRIPVGGALGYLGGLTKPLIGGIPNWGLAGGLGFAQELPGAIKSGNWGGALLGGLGAGLGQKFTSGLAAGFHAPTTGGFGTQVSNAVGGLFGKAPNAGIPQSGLSASTGALSNLSRQAGAGGLLGLKSATPAVGSVLSGSLPGGGFNPNIALPTNALQSVNVPAIPKSASGGGGLPGTQISGTSGGGIMDLLSKGGDLFKLGAAGLASQIGKPPAYNPDSLAGYDKASQFLEGKTLPPSTTEQLNKYLTMSIPDLRSELLGPQAANRSMLELDKQYQQYLAQVQRAAANAGQSIETSSEAQKQYQEVNRQWAEAKANLWSELEYKATQDAVAIHRWSLEQSIQQGQFDVTSAMELAAMMGVDEQLKQSILRKDYETFQRIIGSILGSDFSKQTIEPESTARQTYGLSSNLGQ